MFAALKLKRFVLVPGIGILILCACLFTWPGNNREASSDKFIKWMDFNVNLDCMKDAMKIDIETNAADYPISWTDTIAYLACIYGNDFSKYSKKDLISFCDSIKSGKTAEELTKGMKYFKYYKEAYSAVLEGFLGDYETAETTDSVKPVIPKYGLKVFSPIGDGYSYNHYDDFGASRSYGYKRKHLGNDIMGSVGTPVMSVEEGYIEAVGWNQYGGWRLGIRSNDKKRYYYYAHLRKDRPYAKEFKVGDKIEAGEHIGYLGMTGYSTKENVNNINIPHLHFGMQIIFDESQKDGNNEIWIDVYDIVRLLSQNKAPINKEVHPDTVQRVNTEPIPKLAIIMYHGFTQKDKESEYVINAARLEEDIIYLKEQGFEFVTTKELTDHVYSGIDMPSKTVMLTFDDGYLNNYTYAFPILKKHGVPAVVSPIAYYVEMYSLSGESNPKYTQLKSDEIKEMHQSGLVDFQNHSYNMHSLNTRKGSSRLIGEDSDIYIREFYYDLKKAESIIKEITGKKTDTYVYPFGNISHESRHILKCCGYKVTLSCSEGFNYISRKPDSLFELKRFNRTPERSVRQIISRY